MSVLVLSMLGFTDAFYSVNKAMQDDKQLEYLESYYDTFVYTILNTFGEFEIEGLDKSGVLFFVLASFINLLILLNLVIAIISEIFANVNKHKLEAFYNERAEMIADIWTIFPY